MSATNSSAEFRSAQLSLLYFTDNSRPDPISTEQQTPIGLVDDQPDVAADANRPEVLVFGLFEFVKAHPGVRWIELQVERSRLDGLLLITSQPRETVGKSVCDTEFHVSFD